MFDTPTSDGTEAEMKIDQPAPAAKVNGDQGRQLPRLRSGDLRRYQDAWRIMTPLRRSRKTNKEIAEHLKKTHPGLRIGDRDVVAKVIRYGDAGLLDLA